jgi:uncharacterized protein YggE
MSYYSSWTPSSSFAAAGNPHGPHSTANPMPTIVVTGEGTVAAAPNQATVELGAVTENPSLTIAQRENADTVAKIVDSLLKLGIPKENIQTVSYRIDTEYNFEDGKQTFRGYKVTHLLQIAIDKVERTGIVIDTAVNNGANSVSNIQFSMTHPEVYYNQALSLAIKNAEQKALTIAQTLGATLNRFPVRVQETTHLQEPTPYQATFAVKSAATPIQAGELKISASVKAEYYYYLA